MLNLILLFFPCKNKYTFVRKKNNYIMKKITFIIFLMTSLFSYSQSIDVIDFKVNEPTGQNFNSGTRFDFEFKIKGDYRYSTYGHHQIDLIVYKDAINSSNEIARSYWNREDDYNLYFTSHTLKNWWNTSLINYSTQPNKKFILVVKYAGLTKTLTYNYPDVDSDGDGVFDSQDNCPNQSGPASNSGCPLGNPDLLATQISVNAGGTSTSTPNILTLRKNQWHDFCIKIKNVGQSTSQGNFNTQLVLANGTDLLTSSITANLSSLNTSQNIGSNQEIELCASIYFDNMYLGYNLSSFNYLHILVDYNNNIDEGSNENNNDSYAQLSVSANRSFPKIIISLDNFSRTSVNNKQEEQRALQTIQKGFYVIQSSDGKKSKMIKQ